MVERLEKLVFFLLIFSIPFQTRVFLFSANITSGFNEWASGFIYATDVLILILFCLFIYRGRFEIFSFLTRVKIPSEKSTLLLGGFIVAGFISIFFATSELVAWYRWIKLVEFVGLFFVLCSVLARIKFKDVAFWFVISGVLQGIIAIAQFVIQHSLGLKFLGEAPLIMGGEGVAHIYVAGERVMRAYGTFTNPNVLAAFLALALLFLFYWALKIHNDSRGRIFTLVSLLILVPALFITFSRFSIIIFSLLSVLYFLALIFLPRYHAYRQRALRLFGVFLATTVFFSALLHAELFARFIASSGPQVEALSERFLFNIIALDLIPHNIFGVGLGNFTFIFREIFPSLRESLYQPVHNIFFLIAIEMGVIAVLFFVLFIAKIIGGALCALSGKNNNTLITLLLPFISCLVILTGLFDHFYITLQQGLLMFWVVFAMLNYYAFRR